MTKTVERALLRRRIFGSSKPCKTSRIFNSFGKGPGERKPDYRTMRRHMRTWVKEFGGDFDRKLLYFMNSHRIVKDRIHEVCDSMNINKRAPVKPRVCPDCNGTGMDRVTSSGGNFHPCVICDGRGK